jgi:hypothetical protein
MTSEDPKVNKQGNADKRKHATLMIPQQLQTTSRLESSTVNAMK